jgi:hypothetical protein
VVLILRDGREGAPHKRIRTVNVRILKGDAVVVEKASALVQSPHAAQLNGLFSPCFGSITLAENERLEIDSKYTVELDERDKRKLTVYIIKLSQNLALFVGSVNQP